jgi:hypothetical protein
VRKEEVLSRVKEERNILQKIKGRTASWIGYILRRNCRLKQVIEGKIRERTEVKGRRRRRRKKLLDVLKEKRGYHKLKGEALDGSLCRTRFGRDYGPAARHNRGLIN